MTRFTDHTKGRRRAPAMMLAAIVAAVAAAGCDETPTEPSRGALVTLEVGSEQYRIQLDTAEQIEAARRAQRGGSARIPNGRLVAGTAENTGWSWHVEDVEFVEVTIELCDGRPSDVERAGVQYGGGRYCPWGARILSIVEG